MVDAPKYSRDELASIYELGRMYFQMGYADRAVRIFTGLAAVDAGQTPASIGAGLVELENGRLNEAIAFFRSAVQSGQLPVHARLGMSATFLAQGEVNRARSLLVQIEKEVEAIRRTEPGLSHLWNAFMSRCTAG